MSSKTKTVVNGVESEFEFIQTPKPAALTMQTSEPCGVRTTSVSHRLLAPYSAIYSILALAVSIGTI